MLRRRINSMGEGALTAAAPRLDRMRAYLQSFRRNPASVPSDASSVPASVASAPDVSEGVSISENNSVFSREDESMVGSPVEGSFHELDGVSSIIPDANDDEDDARSLGSLRGKASLGSLKSFDSGSREAKIDEKE